MSTPAESPSASTRTDDAVIECRGLTKTFKVGFWLSRTIHALAGLDLVVRKGEVFGFLGPNGAGKSTTIKILTGLIRPSAGEARVLGAAPGDPSVSRRIGFLPENPVFYDHLTGRELLEYYASLVDVPRTERRERATVLLEQVGLTRAADYQVRRYSKGMVERLGIAQSLLQEPELVILDEPTSGLDPVGRREVRQLIMSLREQGKTVFFSTHIIPDVEAVCDRVGMVLGGKLSAVGTLSELLRSGAGTTEVLLDRVTEPFLASVGQLATSIQRIGSQALMILPEEASIEPVLRASFDAGAQVVRVQRARHSLEELFLKDARPSADKMAPER